MNEHKELCKYYMVTNNYKNDDYGIYNYTYQSALQKLE